MKTEEAGEAISTIVEAMAFYVPEYVGDRGVTRCQFCRAEQSLLDTPGKKQRQHEQECVVMKSQAIMIALGRSVS